jgi:APA family basic amino acid/polyamine antiporter
MVLPQPVARTERLLHEHRARPTQADAHHTKTIEQSIAETDESEYQLKKRLTALDLTSSVSASSSVRASSPSRVARRRRSPVRRSSQLHRRRASACGLAALCYAEFASSVPVSGSAYTFSYATLGELVAWIIGWDLLLELMLGASVVAQGWSAYFGVFLDRLGVTIPESIAYGSHFDLPAFLLVVVLTGSSRTGIKESMRVNLVLVALKLFIVLFVIVAGIGYINTKNYTPFIPDAVPATEVGHNVWTAPLLQTLFGIQPTTFGVGGIFAGASIVFFAYIGFDVVATTAEEAKNPQRDLPIGIIGSLIICTILYVAVALVITGMVPYNQISVKAALATAFETWARAGTRR